MQFMEVAYELRGVLDLLLGIQPDDREDGTPLRHWPYAECLRRWQALVATAPAKELPRWSVTVDPQGLTLAKETVSLLAAHYTAAPEKAAPVTVSAIDLEALVPVAQALDTFSVVYLQWLSNDVVWRAREMVVSSHTKTLQQSWSYDLSEVATAIVATLKIAAGEAVVRWAADAIPGMPYPSLSRTLRVMGATARKLAPARTRRHIAGWRMTLPRAAPVSSGCWQLSPTRLPPRCPIIRKLTRACARCSAIPRIPNTSVNLKRGQR
jgi:hypothetical protein